jgi:hypothetical protein
MSYVQEEGIVVYQSKDGKERKAFDALEWLGLFYLIFLPLIFWCAIWCATLLADGRIWGNSGTLGTPPLLEISVI